MNLIKSIFIIIAPIILILIVIIASNNVVKSINVDLNLGVLLSAFPLILFLSYLLIFKNRARTNPHLPWVSVPSFTGYCLVLYIFIKTSNIHYVNSMVYSLAAFFITFLYIYWYSNNARRKSDALILKHRLPEFTVKDTLNNDVPSDQFMTQKTLIFFFRGNWCPLCMAQIKEIVALYKKFEENNIDVIFISSQSLQHTQKLAIKYNLAFKFYTDEKNQAAKILGIAHKFALPMGFQLFGYDSDSVYPTVIATNENGEILYNDQTSNYRIRPEPKELLAVFL